jgi:hypothetical protein
MQAPRKSDVQAICQKGDEDVRLDACLELVKDRPDRKFRLLTRARARAAGSSVP